VKKEIIFFTFIVFVGNLFSSGTTGMDFLNISAGVRNVGMGETGVATCDDINSSYWNPAGLFHVKQPTLLISHTNWLQDIQYQQMSYAHLYKIEKPEPPFTKVVIAGNLYYLSMAKFQGYNKDGEKTKRISASDMAFAISCGSDIYEFERFPFKKGSRIYMGLNLKTISEKLDTYSSNAFAFDIGAQWQEKSLIAEKGWRMGLNIQNIGSKVKFDRVSGSLPMNIKVGVGYRYILAGDPMLFSLDLNFPKEDDPYVALGLEYLVRDFFSLRFGYNARSDIGSGIRAGMGINVGSYTIDYAFAGFGLLGNTHRLSLTVKFGRLPEVVRIEHNTATIKYHFEKAEKLMKQGRFAEAVLEYNAILEIDPLNMDAFEKMKQANEKLLKLQGIEEPIIKKVSIKKQTEEHYKKALELFSQSKYEEALAEINTSLEIFPDFEKAIKVKEKILKTMGEEK